MALAGIEEKADEGGKASKERKRKTPKKLEKNGGMRVPSFFFSRPTSFFSFRKKKKLDPGLSLFLSHLSNNDKKKKKRVPHRRGPRARRQRLQGPESQAHHAAPLAARHPRRRGTRHADQGDNRRWRRHPAHPQVADQQGRQEGLDSRSSSSRVSGRGCACVFLAFSGGLDKPQLRRVFVSFPFHNKKTRQKTDFIK